MIGTGVATAPAGCGDNHKPIGKNNVDLNPIRTTEIEVGKPLKWPVYDRNKKLLLREGFVIETQNQLDRLISEGLFRNPQWQPPRRPSCPTESDDSPTPAAPAIPFSDVALNNGDTLQLQPQGIKEDTRYYVRFLGYLKNKSIMVTNPVVDGHVLFLREGQDFIVRMFSGKNAYAFKTNILKVNTVPFPYLHLTYPSSVQGVEVRKAQRLQIKLITSVVNPEAPRKKFSATLCDLSLTGARLDAHQELGKPGHNINMTFRVKTELIDSYVDVSAIIRRCDRRDECNDSAQPPWEHGVQFVGLNTEQLLTIQHVLYQRMMESGQP